MEPEKTAGGLYYMPVNLKRIIDLTTGRLKELLKHAAHYHQFAWLATNAWPFFRPSRVTVPLSRVPSSAIVQ